MLPLAWALTRGQLSVSLDDVLVENLPIQQAITLTDRVGLDLVPSTTDLAGAEVELAGASWRERAALTRLAPGDGTL